MVKGASLSPDAKLLSPFVLKMTDMKSAASDLQIWTLAWCCCSVSCQYLDGIKVLKQKRRHRHIFIISLSSLLFMNVFMQSVERVGCTAAPFFTGDVWTGFFWLTPWPLSPVVEFVKPTAGSCSTAPPPGPACPSRPRAAWSVRAGLSRRCVARWHQKQRCSISHSVKTSIIGCSFALWHFFLYRHSSSSASKLLKSEGL